MYHPTYYPVSIRDQYSKLKKNPSLALSGFERWDFFNPAFLSSGVIEFTVNCAGARCEISQLPSLWRSENKENYDTEVVQSSHRFHFFVERLAVGVGDGDRFIMLQTIEDWLNEFDDKALGVAWQPYTVSERLCNWISCWQMLSPQNDHPEFANKWLKSIHHHVLFLATNLEYPASGIVNNHIINNARALYIAGRFLRQEMVSELGRKLLQLHLPTMIGDSGFLREASSHYQLLLTRSVLEIEKIAQVTADKLFIQWLNDLPDKMLAASQQLLPKKLKKLDDMPRIGDVSPDIPFAWFSPCSDQLKANWNSLWGRATHMCSNTLSCDQDGWLAQKNNQWYAVAFSHPCVDEYPVGHGHNDFGSYCLYYNGLPIIVDVGRLDYQPGTIAREQGLSADMHNTVMLDGKSLLPSGHGWASIISGNARRKADCYIDKKSHAIYWSLLQKTDIVWRRQLDISSLNNVSVIDKLNNVGVTEGYLHFSPGADLQKENNNHVLLKIDGHVLNIVIEGISALRLERSNFFPRYGEQCETTRLYWQSDLNGRMAEVKVLISPPDKKGQVNA